MSGFYGQSPMQSTVVSASKESADAALTSPSEVEGAKSLATVHLMDTGMIEAMDTGMIEAMDTGMIEAMDTGMIEAMDTAIESALNTLSMLAFKVNEIVSRNGGP